MPVVTRTLTAKLATPTAHKQRKLRRLLVTYREALRAAVNADADTMMKANEVVTPYELPYQAKDALKSYVPRLLTEHPTREIDDEHPLRLVNRAASFDHSETRSLEFCWEVPLPDRGTNFWIPLHINPEHRETWHGLLDGDIDAGELRLLTRNGDWFLHVTIRRHVEQAGIDAGGEPTRIGIDVGEETLVTACALVGGSPTRPIMCDGAPAKQRRKQMFTTLRRLQRRGAADWRIRKHRERCRNGLTHLVEQTSARVLAYAEEFERSTLVMEDLSGVRRQFDGTPSLNRRLHSWGFSRIQRRIESSTYHRPTPPRSATLVDTSAPDRIGGRSCAPTASAGSRSIRQILTRL